jgi:hypothetical protein
MLASLRVAPVPSLRDAFDPACAPWPSEGVGTKGVLQDSTAPPAGRTKGGTSEYFEAIQRS